MVTYILLFWIPLFGSVFLYGESNNQVSQPPKLQVVEGEDVEIRCNHSISTFQFLFWYQALPGSSPRAIISGYNSAESQGQFAMTFDKGKLSTSLMISKVKGADAAVYYCAVSERNNNFKITFGLGTRLTVIPNIRNSEPSVYVLQPPKGKASEVNPLCLVTDFSPANETKVVVNEIPQNNSPTLVKTDGQWSYGIVAWSSADECKAKYFNEFYSSEKPKDGAQDVCSTGMISEHFETDEKLNSLSLTVLGLRIIFAKTVVINVLMTLRLWRS